MPETRISFRNVKLWLCNLEHRSTCFFSSWEFAVWRSYKTVCVFVCMVVCLLVCLFLIVWSMCVCVCGGGLKYRTPWQRSSGPMTPPKNKKGRWGWTPNDTTAADVNPDDWPLSPVYLHVERASPAQPISLRISVQ
jgi:hypothetical protein